MKYLKKYKLFESVSKNDIIEKLGFDPQLLLDLFVPLEDIGVNVRYIGYARIIEGDLYEDQYIFQYHNGEFNWEEEMPNNFEYIEFAIFAESRDEEYEELIEELIIKLKSIFNDVSYEYEETQINSIYFKDYKNKK